jgi:branched-chain amino acid transport system substrate-binding protein
MLRINDHRGWSRGGQALRQFVAGFIVALPAAFGTASFAHAEILIGLPAPYTGPNAWMGEAIERGAEMAIADLNAAGGILGQPARLIKVDDYCEGEQAVAAANKLVANDVVVVMGHQCSGAAIPASKVYAEAGILMMTPNATNPLVTEQGLENVFRFCGRDDLQGSMAGAYLADHWAGKNIAILHDGQAYGRGLSEEVKRALNARGVSVAIFEGITSGLVDYSDVIDKILAANIDVLYYGGYSPEAGVLIRGLRNRGDDLQFVAGDGINSADFGLTAGNASHGTMFTSTLDLRDTRQAAELVARFRSEHYEPIGPTFLAYGAMQTWAAAVEKAGSLELEDVIEALRTNEFDTIYGQIGFDEKGDVYGYQPFAWYVWQEGDYKPVDPAKLTE